MMLNPKKCVFGVSSGKLLGYMVSSRGIDANPKKVEAIDKLQPPRTRKEIQKLADMMAAVTSFGGSPPEGFLQIGRLLEQLN
jgi:hypothetical protein